MNITKRGNTDAQEELLVVSRAERGRGKTGEKLRVQTILYNVSLQGYIIQHGERTHFTVTINRVYKPLKKLWITMSILK